MWALSGSALNSASNSRPSSSTICTIYTVAHKGTTATSCAASRSPSETVTGQSSASHRVLMIISAENAPVSSGPIFTATRCLRAGPMATVAPRHCGVLSGGRPCSQCAGRRPITVALRDRAAWGPTHNRLCITRLGWGRGRGGNAELAFGTGLPQSQEARVLAIRHLREVARRRAGEDRTVRAVGREACHGCGLRQCSWECGAVRAGSAGWSG